MENQENRPLTAPEIELRQHVIDAAIAAQLPPPTDQEFLAKCRAVQDARAKLP